MIVDHERDKWTRAMCTDLIKAIPLDIITSVVDDYVFIFQRKSNINKREAMRMTGFPRINKKNHTLHRTPREFPEGKKIIDKIIP